MAMLAMCSAPGRGECVRCGASLCANHSIRKTGWRSTKAPGSHPARAWRNTINRLHLCSARLAEVEIDHRDFDQVLQTHDGPITCFYLDPPPLPATQRKSYCSHQEMSFADHERLLARVGQMEGMTILSGYDHPLYQEALAGWECLRLEARWSSTMRALDTQASPAALDAPLDRTRTECIWRNPVCLQGQLTRFDGLPDAESKVGA